MAGIPPFISEMSVVVPPISTMRQSPQSVNARPPSTLAAGPLSIVSTGLRRAKLSAIKLPSLRTIITGADMPRAASALCTAYERMDDGQHTRVQQRCRAALHQLRSPASSLAITTGTQTCDFQQGPGLLS
jgi:hypothetical protein